MTEPNVMRAPVVGAVGGGVGATVLAALLECPEAGVVAGDGSQPVDVLVCRSTAHSVRDAIAVAARMGGAPVLAVVADCSHSPPSAVRHRLRMAGPNLTGIVAVPWWDWLRETDDPAAHTTTLAAGAAARSKTGKSVLAIRDQLVAAVTPLLSAPLPSAPAVPPDEQSPPAPPQAHVC